mgnify:CR=1 FL=1
MGTLERLAKAAQGGDCGARERLLGRLLIYAERQLRAIAPGLDQATRDDLAQEAVWDFLQNGLPRFDENRAALTTYFYWFIRKAISRHFRRQLRESSLVASSFDSCDFPDECKGDFKFDPATVTAREDLIKAVRTALAQLREIERSVILLRYGEELSYEKISAMLGIPENYARVYAYRARAKVRTLLATERIACV